MIVKERDRSRQWNPRGRLVICIGYSGPILSPDPRGGGAQCGAFQPLWLSKRLYARVLSVNLGLYGIGHLKNVMCLFVVGARPVKS